MCRPARMSTLCIRITSNRLIHRSLPPRRIMGIPLSQVFGAKTSLPASFIRKRARQSAFRSSRTLPNGGRYEAGLPYENCGHGDAIHDDGGVRSEESDDHGVTCA